MTSLAARMLGNAVFDCPVFIEVTRKVPGAYNSDGRFIRGSEETFTIRATVQPVTGRELQLLFPNSNARETVKVYSKTELRGGDNAANPTAGEPDRFDYRGRTYEVQTVTDWEVLGDYFKCIALRVTA